MIVEYTTCSWSSSLRAKSVSEEQTKETEEVVAKYYFFLDEDSIYLRVDFTLSKLLHFYGRWVLITSIHLLWPIQQQTPIEPRDGMFSKLHMSVLQLWPTDLVSPMGRSQVVPSSIVRFSLPSHRGDNSGSAYFFSAAILDWVILSGYTWTTACWYSHERFPNDGICRMVELVVLKF